MRSSFTAAPAVTPGVVMADERSLCPPAMRLRALSIDRLGADRAIELVGLAPSLNDALIKLEKIAKYREPVLITGESGAGKEFFAQAVHLFGGARQAPVRPGELPAVPGRQPHRQRAVRPHPRQLHRGGGRSQGRLRGGRRRRHLPRRDRRPARQRPGDAAARPGHRRVPPGRRHPLADGRRPGGVGDQSAAEPAGDDQPVPLRPAVPAAAVPHRHSAAARARRRLAPARRLLAGAAGPPVRRRQALLRGVDAGARAGALAGQRPAADRRRQDGLRDGRLLDHRAGRLHVPAPGGRTGRRRQPTGRAPTSASSISARSSGPASTKPS